MDSIKLKLAENPDLPTEGRLISPFSPLMAALERKTVVKTAKHGKIFREGNLRPHYHVGAIRRGLNGRITGKTATFRTIADDPFPTTTISSTSNVKRIFLELKASLMRRDFRERHRPKIFEK